MELGLKSIEKSTEMSADLASLIAVIEQGFDAVVITDKDWLIEYVNPAFEKLKGYKKEEIVGYHLSVLDNQIYTPEALAHLKEVLDRGEVWVEQIKTKHKNGKDLVVDVRGFAVKTKRGDISGYVLIARDITEEAELQRCLLHAQKMQAIGTLAGGIAHDFNNILSGIMGFAELAIKEVPVDSPIFKKIEQIVQAAQRAKELIQQILSFSRYVEDKKRPVQCASIIKEVLKFIRAALPAEIEIKTNVQSDSAILVNPTQLHQVIINLCTNAYHAMQENGGTLTINLKDVIVNYPEAKRLDLPIGKYVKIEVSDTGHGISPEIIDRIFEPYFTTKKEKGTGLGLAVVYGIIKDAGGAITVNSKLGEGTTFSIYLPCVEQKGKEEEEIKDITLCKGHGKILLIDDEKLVLEVEREMLESLGYYTTACLNPYEALNEIELNPKKYDLVITDLSMPGISGEKLAKKIISLCPDLPVILCTGFGDLVVEERLKKMGIKEILRKPVSLKQFAQTIQQVLDSPKFK